MNANKEIEHVIVIDVGGTNFRSSVFVEGKGLIEPPRRVRTPNFINSPDLPIEQLQAQLVDKIVATVERYKNADPKLKLVGISFPAPITSEGVVNQACTVWGDKGQNFPLLKTLSELLPNTYLVVANDITAAAERYANMEEYQNVDYFAVITISSGIGSKIYDVKQGEVILDKRSIGGEAGHVKVDFSDDAPVCDCGGKGHLAAFSSGRAIERLAINEAEKFPDEFRKSLLFSLSSNPKGINNQLLVRAIKEGDSFCLRILDKATFPLACSIAHISGNIGADKYIIIGGFALNCGEKYLESLRRNLLKTDFYSRKAEEISTLVALGVNDDNDCLIGIGLLAQKKYAETNQ